MPNRKPVQQGAAFLFLLAFLCIGASVFVQDAVDAVQALYWRVLDDQNDPQARHENAYVEVDGNFYLMGGRGSRRVELFDPTDSTWSNRSFPPGDIQIHHFQPVVSNDTVYIIGAYTGTYPDEPTLDQVYKYVPAIDQWIVGSDIPVGRRRGAAGAAVYNGKIYVVAGSVGGHGGSAVRTNLFDEYDPLTDTWTTLPNAPFTRDHVQVAVVGDKLYVAGGRNGGNGDTVEEVDIYDFTSGAWSTLPSPAGDLPTPRGGASTLAVGHYVMVLGGESTQTLAHNEVEALNTLTNTWVIMQPLNIGRHGTQAIFYNDNIYVTVGSGQKGGSPELTSHEILETGGQTNLPVELAPDFKAQIHEKNARLTWRTLSETNNAGFEIQQKINGTFDKIGFVSGAGTSVAIHNYSFEVDNLAPGRHVFRLKQLDFNGSFEYSKEVSALIAIQDGFFFGDVYPNPFNPEARFTLTLAREQHVRIRVYDMLGRSIAVLFDGFLLPDEPRSIPIKSEGWAGGKYLLVIEGTYFTASRNFTVLN